MRVSVLGVLCALLPSGVAGAAVPPSTPLVYEQAQTAGIDGRDWDRPYPGATTFDAVHRAVLLRFPGAAEAVKQRLDSGLLIATAEIVLDYDGYEIVPQGYAVRTGLGEAKWKADPPQWHVVAWPLRRPWIGDKEIGPTFNAYINGAGFWSKYGAADTTKDREATRFGPAELSLRRQQARIDVTAALTGPSSVPDVGTRLRAVEENGFLLKKLEIYDARYRDPGNSFEWAMPTGGHGLKFRSPRLVIGFKAGDTAVAAAVTTLPPAINVVALRARLKKDGAGGAPTAVMPAPDAFKKLAQRAAPRPPPGMSGWQFERVMELYRIGGDRVSVWAKAVQSGNYSAYTDLVREILATPPRYWQGWEIQDDLLIWYLYRDLLPAYVQEHMRAYWDAWLMPDIPTSQLFHPQSGEAIAYWQKTGDWRGRTSFFRDGFNYSMSTQNFNHTAPMGALLGGHIIGSQYAMADGRHGLEQFPLRTWSMLDGSAQEMLDHYYFSITLSAQKMFADFGPTELDRLMGRVILDRSIELLATAYHPNLRRLVSPSGRANPGGILVTQDGIYGLLHTLSRNGVVNYRDQPFEAKVHGMPIWGRDFPPGRVALQTLQQKWASDWVTEVLDDKRFPFEETSADTIRSNFNPPLWRRMYLGRYYGLASQDIKAGTADVIAQWNHTAAPSSRMEDLATLTLRYAINEPDMATTDGGIMPYAGGLITYQHKNRAIVCSKPRTEKDRIIALAGKAGLKSLSTVIALWNFRAQPGWEIYADGKKLEQFPAALKANQVITIHDGVSYVGIIPLPATDLGRKNEVVIGFGGGGKNEPTGAPIGPALTIASYNLQRDAAARPEDLDWPTINTASYGGFVVEMGDETEYGTFAAFEKRMQSNRLITRWEPAKKLLHVEYRTGADVMEMGCATDYAQSEVHYAVMPGQHTKAVPYRRINGAWPYLPAGIERDTSISQQGTTGRLEKNGAVLRTERNRKAYLITEPVTGTYTGYNPLPDPTPWSLEVPGGIVVKADGKVGLLKVEVQPGQNRLSFEYAVKDDQNGPEMAHNLLLTGFRRPPQVQRAGKPIAPLQRTVAAGGQATYVVPLLVSGTR